MVEETVDRILDWQLIRFFRVQKPEPVLLLENEAKHQLKQIRTGESEIFLDVCLSKMFQDFQFVENGF
ncbi:hypothetical protein FB379_1466 [Aeribacillus composti]|nr:hypothetical protein FB379_1466 [Aeribacillus composti]